MRTIILVAALLFAGIAFGQTGSAALSWRAPTQNTDGSALTNLAGYRIYYGTSSGALTQTIQIANPSTTSHIVEHLGAGTYYFAVRAYTTAGQESGNSNVASKTISGPTIPNPPTNLTVVQTTAFRLNLGYANKVQLARIGTVPLGTACDGSMPVLGVHVIKDRHKVKLDAGKSKPLAVLAKCG